MTKLQIIGLAFVAFAASGVTAQQAETFTQQISDCETSSVETDSRINACELALRHEHLTASERSDIFVTIADLQFFSKDYTAAMGSYQAAIRLDPENILARDQKEILDRAAPAIFENDANDLISFANGGLDEDPEDPALIHLRAIGYQRLGDLETAISDFEGAMQLTRYPHLLRFERARVRTH